MKVTSKYDKYKHDLLKMLKEGYSAKQTSLVLNIDRKKILAYISRNKDLYLLHKKNRLEVINKTENTRNIYLTIENLTSEHLMSDQYKYVRRNIETSIIPQYNVIFSTEHINNGIKYIFSISGIGKTRYRKFCLQLQSEVKASFASHIDSVENIDITVM